VVVTYSEALKVKNFLDAAFLPMSTKYDPKQPEEVYEKMSRKEDYPIRYRWLLFLGYACHNCFNPLMPNKTGICITFDCPIKIIQFIFLLILQAIRAQSLKSLRVP
jgi:hypothetical protein